MQLCFPAPWPSSKAPRTPTPTRASSAHWCSTPTAECRPNSYGRFPSLASVMGLHLWKSWQRLRGNSGLSPVTPSSTVQVDWVTGAAMLVRRQAIAEVGPLDEGFFLYYEDVDWCWRMRAAGWQVLLEPTAKALHHLGGSETSPATVSKAYRDSFYRYCDLHGLWGLKAVSRLGLAMRRLLGGRS